MDARAFLPFVIAVIGGAAVVTACSSSQTAPTPAPVTCDSSLCAPGNKCIASNGETKCRKTCASNVDAAASCPFGYTCVQQPDVEAFCVKDNKDLKPSGKGLFGAPCNPAEGFDNPACDSAQGFLCYGESPTDGNAYCTTYDCESDRDCGAGFGCATINEKPNVSTTKRVVGATVKACIRRSYCSTCTADLDCPDQNGKKAHCVTDDNNVGFCSPECDKSENCQLDAKCVDFGAGYKSCYPRANVCVGDGSICSPCRSDADCGEEGACVKGGYTPEKSCAKKSKITCKSGATQGTDFDCPKPTNGAKAQIRCLGSVFDAVPQNFCHGLYALGESGDVGCFTPNR